MIETSAQLEPQAADSRGSGWSSQLERDIEDLVVQTAPDSLRDLTLWAFRSGGRRIRAKICRELGLELGVKAEVFEPWAVVCEVLHNASLVHDDIQDQDETRRGLPSVWKKFGVSQAISLGDHLISCSLLGVDRVQLPSHSQLELMRAVAICIGELSQGQVLELKLVDHIFEDALEEKFLKAVELKTSALFKLPLAGLLLGSELAEKDRLHLQKGFHYLGQAFQALDDALDFQGLKAGRSSCEDFRTGRVNSILIHQFRLAPETRGLFRRVYEACEDREGRQEELVTQLISAIQESGASDQAFQSARASLRCFREELQFVRAKNLSLFTEKLERMLMAPFDSLFDGDKNDSK